jgi:hypothetical protein
VQEKGTDLEIKYAFYKEGKGNFDNKSNNNNEREIENKK